MTSAARLVDDVRTAREDSRAARDDARSARNSALETHAQVVILTGQHSQLRRAVDASLANVIGRIESLQLDVRQLLARDAAPRPELPSFLDIDLTDLSNEQKARHRRRRMLHRLGKFGKRATVVLALAFVGMVGTGLGFAALRALHLPIPTELLKP